MNLGNQLGKGGEGTVYAVDDGGKLALKVYSEALTLRQRGKLERQIELSLQYPELKEFAAWPLNKANLGEHGGFLMPFILGRPIHQLYRPVDRREHFSFADWSSLVHVARNVAATFNVLHRCKIVMGDVNESNMFVTPTGEVRLIDCDSYQIPKADSGFFTCDVGVPMWTPPELQGVSFEALTRTLEHDRFGLAVLIFHLMFMGRHPFSGVPVDPEETDPPSIDASIKAGFFAYSLRKTGQTVMKQPPHTLSLAALPEQVIELFERAFEQGGAARPTAEEWHAGLGTMEFARCDWGHVYEKKQESCPWCAIWQGGGPNFFFVAGAKPPGSSTNELEVISREVQVLAPLQFTVPNRAEVVIPTTPGEVFPSHIGRTRLAFYAGCVLLAAAGLGWIAAPSALIFCLVVGVIGGGLMFGGKNNPAYGKEVTRREQNYQTSSEKLDGLLAEAHQEIDLYRRTFAHQKTSQLQRIGVLAGHQRSLATLRATIAEDHARELQLGDFLASQKLADAGIRDLVEKRLKLLQDAGIETAWDVKKLKEVPGLTRALLAQIKTWAVRCELSFQFDPAIHLSSAAEKEVDLKVAAVEQQWVGEAVECKQRLLVLSERAQSSFADFQVNLSKALQNLGKALADREQVEKS